MTSRARPLPAAARPFVDFCRLLRDNGFPIGGDRTATFLKAIGLLGPRGMADIYWAARATLAPPPDRLDEFDGLFDAMFGDGVAVAAEAIGDGEETTAAESGRAEPLAEDGDKQNESGEAATDAEALALRRFATDMPDARLTTMQRRLARTAPRRRGFRRVAAKTGDQPDLRRSLARMLRGGTSAAMPVWARRREKTRRVLLLVDISGSMKAHTDDTLRFAHALTQALPAVETFSFGTRLTRLTLSLRHKDIARALAEIAPAVADWGGGTRIADSISAFLGIQRFSRASRGALTIVVSDGLERGDPEAMAHAVRRLTARSWRLAWLTPLAADPAFSPETAGLRAILGIVDHLGDGSGIGALADFVEAAAILGRRLPAAGRADAGTGGRRNGDAGHRRASPHLAAGRPAVARGADAAAHLRAV